MRIIINILCASAVFPAFLSAQSTDEALGQAFLRGDAMNRPIAAVEVQHCVGSEKSSGIFLHRVLKVGRALGLSDRDAAAAAEAYAARCARPPGAAAPARADGPVFEPQRGAAISAQAASIARVLDERRTLENFSDERFISPSGASAPKLASSGCAETIYQSCACPLNCTSDSCERYCKLIECREDSGTYACRACTCGMIGAADFKGWQGFAGQFFSSLASPAYAADIPTQKKGKITEITNADGDFVILDKQALRDAAEGAGVVGVRLAQKNEEVYAGEVLEDSPAMKSGLEIGDVILSVDGRSTAGRSIAAISRSLRGKPGTPVVLGVKKSLTGRNVKLSIIRKELFPAGQGETGQNITVREIALKSLGAQSCPKNSDGCNFLIELNGMCRYTCSKKK